MRDMSQWHNRFNVLSSDEYNNNVDSNETAESETMSTPSTIDIVSSPPSRIYIRTTQAVASTQVQVQLKTVDTGSLVSITALLDSGATGLFLDSKFVKK